MKKLRKDHCVHPDRKSCDCDWCRVVAADRTPDTRQGFIHTPTNRWHKVTAIHGEDGENGIEVACGMSVNRYHGLLVQDFIDGMVTPACRECFDRNQKAAGRRGFRP